MREFYSLTDRERDILLKVAELYIKTGKPVGSRVVQKAFKLPFSPATIRNVMSDLEEKGFLFQPHTSAGRIPTDAGLKVYITHKFLEIGSLNRNYINRVVELAGSLGKSPNLEDVISKILNFLQSSTGYLGFGASFLERLIVDEINLIKLTKDRFLVVLKFLPDYVVHQQVFCEASEVDLARISRMFTKRFKGKTLEEVKTELASESFEGESVNLRSKLLSVFSSIETFEFQGMPNIADMLSEDIERLREILKLFEERKLLKEVLLRFFREGRETDVILGSETKHEVLEPFGFVVSRFRIGKRSGGVVGIMGPKRMNYDVVIPTVESVAKALSMMFGEVI
jgi:heat-inducible transcriptional repressor